MSVIDSLIYDRTEADVGVTDKGELGADDLNRVGQAVALVAERLKQCGIFAACAPKTDWATGDEPSAAQMAGYMADIAAIRAAIAYYSATPEAPENYNALGVNDANAIEKILFDCDRLLTNMTAAYRHSGTFNSNQRGLIL